MVLEDDRRGEQRVGDWPPPAAEHRPGPAFSHASAAARSASGGSVSETNAPPPAVRSTAWVEQNVRAQRLLAVPALPRRRVGDRHRHSRHKSAPRRSARDLDRPVERVPGPDERARPAAVGRAGPRARAAPRRHRAPPRPREPTRRVEPTSRSTASSHATWRSAPTSSSSTSSSPSRVRPTWRRPRAGSARAPPPSRPGRPQQALCAHRPRVVRVALRCGRAGRRRRTSTAAGSSAPSGGTARGCSPRRGRRRRSCGPGPRSSVPPRPGSSSSTDGVPVGSARRDL